MEATLMPYRTSGRQEMPQVWGISSLIECPKLVLCGIRVLAEQHYGQDSTNESKTWIFLDQ